MILQAKNITARQFAEEIGIQPSGMSHILGGRNNPSLDFVLKVLKRYPEIDAGWLLLGKGAMYGSGVESGDRSVASREWRAEGGEQVANASPQGEMDFGAEDTVEQYDEAEPSVDEVDSMGNEVQAAVANQLSAVSGERCDEVKHVMVIYGDNTYEVLTPRKRR